MKTVAYAGFAIVVGSHVYLLVTDKPMTPTERQLHSVINIAAAGLLWLQLR